MAKGSVSVILYNVQCTIILYIYSVPAKQVKQPINYLSIQTNPIRKKKKKREGGFWYSLGGRILHGNPTSVLKYIAFGLWFAASRRTVASPFPH